MKKKILAIMIAVMGVFSWMIAPSTAMAKSPGYAAVDFHPGDGTSTRCYIVEFNFFTSARAYAYYGTAKAWSNWRSGAIDASASVPAATVFVITAETQWSGGGSCQFDPPE